MALVENLVVVVWDFAAAAQRDAWLDASSLGFLAEPSAVVIDEQTMAELAAKYEIHHTTIAQWTRQAIEGMSATFSGKSETMASADPARSSGSTRRSASCCWNGFLRGASVRLGLIRGRK